MFHLLETDLGRPIHHIRRNFENDRFIEDCHDLLKTFVPRETEVQTKNGEWYLRRMLPYRTADDRIDWVSVTYTNITEHKLPATPSTVCGCTPRASWRPLHPLVVLDATFKVQSANAAFYKVFQVDPKDIKNQLFHQINGRQWDDPRLLAAIDQQWSRARARSMTSSSPRCCRQWGSNVSERPHDPRTGPGVGLDSPGH